MNVRQLFPAKYVNAEDLGQRDVTVTIKALTFVVISGQRKPVLHFEGATKAMLLNRTNALAIAKLHGNETDEWIGKRIVLFASLTKFKGEDVPCVRVRGN